jgi:hypothetical protein
MSLPLYNIAIGTAAEGGPLARMATPYHLDIFKDGVSQGDTERDSSSPTGERKQCYFLLIF